MKILHVVRQFAPSVGGLENYVKSLASHQQARGHTVEVLTLNVNFADPARARLPAREVIDGLSVRRIGFVGFRRFFIPFLPIGWLRRFDVIHVHNTDGCFDGVALLRPLLPARLVATSHGLFFHTPNFGLIKKIYFQTVTRFSAAQYHTVFATSGNDDGALKRIAKRVVLQLNAVEPLDAKVYGGDDFIYLGRLAPHKDVAGLVRAFAVLKTVHKAPGVLHVVGPEWGVKTADLQALAAELGVAQSITFHGFAPLEDLRKILAGCGYFVSASRFEGFGMSLVEGMSVGLIPFVQANESFRELIGEAGLGLCLDFADPRQAAAEIAAALPTLKPEARQAAQRFASQFSWPALVTRTLAVYEA